MLGPIKKYPNGNIFLEGMRPSKPQESASSVCLFSLIICTVKVCSSNRHYLFSCFLFLPTHSWNSKQCSFFCLSGERVLVWNVRCNPRELFSSSSSNLESRLRFPWPLEKECRYRSEQGGDVNGRLERWPLRRVSPPNELGPNSRGVQYVLEKCAAASLPFKECLWQNLVAWSIFICVTPFFFFLT